LNEPQIARREPVPYEPFYLVRPHRILQDPTLLIVHRLGEAMIAAVENRLAVEMLLSVSMKDDRTRSDRFGSIAAVISSGQSFGLQEKTHCKRHVAGGLLMMGLPAVFL
jgi:hypothetical protein